MTYDWSRFDIFFYYDVPAEDVYRAWGSVSGLESFILDRASFQSKDGLHRKGSELVESGDEYEWTWRHQYTLKGKIISVVVGKELHFTFGDMEVKVHISESDKVTEIHLEQFNIPETDDGRVFGHLNCRSCWIFFMTNLKSVLEDGKDLRDSSPGRVSSMEVGFMPPVIK